MASKGIGGGFKIDSSVNVLTDVSNYLRAVNGTSDLSKLDATYLQPDVAAPLTIEISGKRTRTLSLTALYSAAAFTFFTAIEGLEGLDYNIGPDGFTAGDQKLYGLCNCLSVSFPNIDVDSVETFTVEITVTSFSVGVF